MVDTIQPTTQTVKTYRLEFPVGAAIIRVHQKQVNTLLGNAGNREIAVLPTQWTEEQAAESWEVFQPGFWGRQ